MRGGMHVRAGMANPGAAYKLLHHHRVKSTVFLLSNTEKEPPLALDTNRRQGGVPWPAVLLW